YDPGLLMQGSWVQICWALLSGISAVFAFAYMWMGYIKKPISLVMRVLLAVSGVMCLMVWPAVTLGGFAILVAVYFLNR
ncbi:MAG: TRAP transporter permease, partial [Synergistaceae bacterium]|nr:TRAP transporter permease [Synergistaceae bacterium]